MKHALIPHAALSCFLFIALPAPAIAQPQTTPLQTMPFEGAFNGNSGIIGDNAPLFASAFQALDEFEKFNPALGTLVEVLITIEVNALYQINITSDSIIDPDSPFSIELENNDMNLIQASVIYSPTDAESGHSVTFDNESFSGASIYEENPGAWGAPDEFYFTNYTAFTDFGGFSINGDETPSTGSIAASETYFNPDDFIGTGNVTGLSFDLISIIELAGYVDNLGYAVLDLLVQFFPGNATLQYVYLPADPTPTPPTITGYAKTGTTHVIDFTGAPDFTGWKLKGSADLAAFPNDHTPDAAFTEVSSGVYQCILILPSLANEPDYFFRIERD